MPIQIKNIDSVTHTWAGQEFLPGGTYHTESARDARRFGEDDFFIKDYTDGKAEVYDGEELLGPVAKVLFFLQNGKVLAPADEEDKPYVRVSATKLNWYYSPRSLDFYSGKAGSLYNRKSDGPRIEDGTDYGDAWMKFYQAGEYGVETEMVQGANETDEEFQARLDAYCTKTVVEFENDEAIDIWGAKLSISHTPTNRAYLWCVAVPDVPYEYGGSKPFMGGGMNLKLMAPLQVVQFDAKTSKELHYSADYHTNKIAIVIKHEAGENIGIQMIFDYYEE